jgi:hypothetical protein
MPGLGVIDEIFHGNRGLGAIEFDPDFPFAGLHDGYRVAHVSLLVTSQRLVQLTAVPWPSCGGLQKPAEIDLIMETTRAATI